jgi:hypothetical protein
MDKNMSKIYSSIYLIAAGIYSVFGLIFGFDFCTLKAKSQAKGLEPGSIFFSKSMFSCSAKIKAPLNLLLSAFE